MYAWRWITLIDNIYVWYKKQILINSGEEQEEEEENS